MRALILLVFLLGLGACAPMHKGRPDNFLPYVGGQADSIPMAYGDEAWVYPADVSTADVLARWKEARLVMGAFRTKKSPILEVYVGPNFYALAPMQQRGLAHAVAQIYGIGAPEAKKGNMYLVRDNTTGKPVGAYAAQGLQLY